MKRSGFHRPRRCVRVVLVAARTCVVPRVFAASSPRDAVERIKAGGLDAGWQEGKAGVSRNGRTMIYLCAKSGAGYDRVALVGVESLRRQQGGVWVAVPVEPLPGAEPKSLQGVFAD